MKYVIYALFGFIMGVTVDGLADRLFPEDKEAQTVLKGGLWAIFLVLMAAGIFHGVTL